MRGVSLGLFDESTAMQKFEAWNADHEKLVAEREETHRKHKAEKRHAAMTESVKKVEEKMAAKAQAAVAEAEAEIDAEDAADAADAAEQVNEENAG